MSIELRKRLAGSFKGIISKQQIIREQSELMMCRYLINVIEDDVNFLNQNQGSLLLAKKRDYQKAIKGIGQNVSGFLKQYKRICSKKKIELMFRLISSLAVLHDARVISLVPLVEFKNVIVYLTHTLESLIGNVVTHKEQNKHESKQHTLTGKYSSFSQRTRVSPSEDRFHRTNRVTQVSERSRKTRGNLTILQSGNRLFSNRKLNTKSSHNLGSTSGRTAKSMSKTNNNDNNNDNNNNNNQALSQGLKQAMSLLGMARADYVLVLVFGCSNNHSQLSPYKNLLQDSIFMNTSSMLLQQFRHPLLQSKLKLYYSQHDYLQFQRNCGYLRDTISLLLIQTNNNTNSGNIKSNQKQLQRRLSQTIGSKSDDDETAKLKVDIYELIAQQKQQLINRRFNNTPQPIISMISTAKFKSILNQQQSSTPYSCVQNIQNSDSHVNDNQKRMSLEPNQSKVSKKPSIDNQPYPSKPQSLTSSHHSKTSQSKIKKNVNIIKRGSRISTRWNNQQNIPLVNMIQESKQQVQRSKSKVHLKSQFSFNESNKIQKLDYQIELNISSNKSLNYEQTKQKSVRSGKASQTGNAGESYEDIHRKIISFLSLLKRISSSNISQKQINLILNHNIQSYQTQLSYIRLMTLLSHNFSSLCMRKQPLLSDINNRKKTCYQERQLVQKGFNSQNIISKILKSYLNCKEKRIQQKLAQFTPQRIYSSLKSLSLYDLRRLSNQLFIKPFIIHLEKPSKVRNDNQHGIQTIIFSKVQFQVSGNCKPIKNVVDTKERKCTGAQLRQWGQCQGDYKIESEGLSSLNQMKGRKQSQISLGFAQSNKKEMNQSKNNSQQMRESVDILQVPLAIVMKSNSGIQGEIIKEIPLLITLRALYQKKDQDKDGLESEMSDDQQSFDSSQHDSQSSSLGNSSSQSDELSILSLRSSQFLHQNPYQYQLLNPLQGQKISSSGMDTVKTHSIHDFYDGYFHIQAIVQDLIGSFYELNQNDLGVCLKINEFKHLQGANFREFVIDKNKLALKKNIRLLKNSPILKSILISAPSEVTKLQNFLNEKTKEKYNFIDLELEIKIQKQSGFENLSQKKVILEKYAAQTSHKTILNLNKQKVVKSFQSIKIIEKDKNFFFFKTSLLFTQRIDGASEIISDNFQVFLIEETYCENFHELYEKQIYPFNAIKQIVYNLTLQQRGGENSHLFIQLVMFLESKFCKILKPLTLMNLKSLSNKKPDQKLPGFQFNINLLQDFISKKRQKSLSPSSNLQKHDSHKKQQKIYSIKIVEIADNCSRTQESNVEVIEYFAQKEKSQSQFWISSGQFNLRNKGKSNNFQRNKNQMMSKTKEPGSIKIFNEIQVDLRGRQNRIKKDADQLYFPCTPNAFERKGLRKPTIETNKNFQPSEGQGKMVTLKAIQTVAQKSKKSIGFTPTINQFNSLENESLYTQKQIHNQTQMSLKSNHSKSRLPRHAYQMTSLLPTSGIVLKSMRSIKNSLFDKKCSKKTVMPSLKPCLLTFNNLSHRKQSNCKTSKRLYHTDNFIHLKQEYLNKKCESKVIKQSEVSSNISLINKNKFYQSRGISFVAVIKRSFRFIICLVQFEQTNDIQTEVQVFAGLYHQNPNLIKIISGRILTQIFKSIIRSHQQLQNFINYELSSNFEINNTPLKRIYLKLDVKEKGGLEAEQNCIQGIIRPKLGIQKYVRTKMLARFMLGLRNVAHLFQQVNPNYDHSYCLVSIFAYTQLPNQDICIQVYLPRNSKNIVFMVQGELAFDYFYQLVHNVLAERFFLENSKSKSVEKMAASSRLSDANKRAKPRLSIFTPQSQYNSHQNSLTKRSSLSKNRQSLKSFDNKFSNLKANSIQSSTKNNLSRRNQSAVVVSSYKSRDWKALFADLDKVKRQIKFNQYFGFQIRDNEYFLHLTTLPDIQYKGIQVLRKKIYAKIHVKNTQKNILQIRPQALQIVSISYEEKELSLLSFFTPQTFSKVKINQRYIKLVDGFGNEIYHNEYLQNALKRSNYSFEIQIGKNQKQRSPQSSHLINKIKFNALYYLPLNKPKQTYRKDQNTILKYKQLLMGEKDEDE